MAPKHRTQKQFTFLNAVVGGTHRDVVRPASSAELKPSSIILSSTYCVTSTLNVISEAPCFFFNDALRACPRPLRVNIRFSSSVYQVLVNLLWVYHYYGMKGGRALRCRD